MNHLRRIFAWAVFFAFAGAVALAAAMLVFGFVYGPELSCPAPYDQPDCMGPQP